jgi:glycosyltransferase involved in cell wall biosynthesis
MNLKVSVIMPVYNGEKFIDAAILRLKEQTYKDIELIVIDDSSTDETFKIAKSYENDKCKVYKQENAGAAVARNEGLKHATGGYVQFLDVDDLLSNDKIEKQVKALIGQNNKVAVCNYIEFFEKSELEGCKEPTYQSAFIKSSDSPVDFLINLYGGNGKAHFIQTNSWLTPRNLIEKAGWWRSYRCPDDDGEFFARILLASDGIAYVPGVYNYYRRTAKEMSLSSSTNNKYLQNTLLTIDLKFKYLLKYSNSSALRKAMATQYLRFAIFTFPNNLVLSEIAYRRFKALKTKVEMPVLGGKWVEALKIALGWKAARLFKYYLRETWQ